MESKKLVECGMDIMGSFMKAVFEAGGMFSVEDLKNMSAYDLLSSLATNKIKFVYEWGK